MRSDRRWEAKRSLAGAAINQSIPTATPDVADRPIAHARLGHLRDVVENEELRLRARRDCVGAALIVAEFDEEHLIVELLDNCAHLPPRKPVCRDIRQQCDHIQKGWHVAFYRPLSFHHSTQQVTNRGT